MQNLKNIDIQDILLNHEQIDEISTLVKPCVYDKVVHSWFKKKKRQQTDLQEFEKKFSNRMIEG